jgi:hypothetical protein
MLGDVGGWYPSGCEFGSCGSGFTSGSPAWKYQRWCSLFSTCDLQDKLQSLLNFFHAEPDGPEGPNMDWPGNGSLTPNYGPQDGVCTTGRYFGPKMNSNPAILKCCQAHDNCYTQNHCNYSSWVPLPGGPFSGGACRSVCNAAVVGCIIDAK